MSYILGACKLKKKHVVPILIQSISMTWSDPAPTSAGDIDFDTMYEAHGGFGVCFYLAFVLIMTFIVLNMFLAILGDSFTEVKEELKEAKNQYELLDFCKGIVMVSRSWVSLWFQYGF